MPINFLEAGLEMMDTRPIKSEKRKIRLFRSWFGVHPVLCSHVWSRLENKGWTECSTSVRPVHLLWGLLFLRCYLKGNGNATRAGCTENTFREKAWFIIKGISSLYPGKIKWKNRLKGNKLHKSRVTIDTIDFSISEPPTPDSKDWYSENLDGAGLRYEIAVCISTGHIVWTNGPYECGVFDNYDIFQLDLCEALRPGETVVAGENFEKEDVKVVAVEDAKGPFHKQGMLLARAQHDAINRRFKAFQILSQKFRHDRDKHGLVFRAVACLIQAEIKAEVMPSELYG